MRRQQEERRTMHPPRSRGRGVLGAAGATDGQHERRVVVRKVLMSNLSAKKPMMTPEMVKVMMKAGPARSW